MCGCVCVCVSVGHNFGHGHIEVPIREWELEREERERERERQRDTAGDREKDAYSFGYDRLGVLEGLSQGLPASPASSTSFGQCSSWWSWAGETSVQAPGF